MKNIEHLILVAGASCAGKTFLTRKLLRKQRPHLSKQLGIGDAEEWTHSDLSAAQKTTVPAGPLILQYDCYNSNRVRVVQELFDRSVQTTVLTLCASPRILTQRNIHRLLWDIRKSIKSSKKRKKRKVDISLLWRRIITNGNRLNNVIQCYTDWFKFLDGQAVEHYWMPVGRAEPVRAFRYAENPSASMKAVCGKLPNEKL